MAEIHALTDRFYRPLAFLMTDGPAADCTVGALLLERLPACSNVLADKGFYSDAIRRRIEMAEVTLNISPKICRRCKPCFSAVLYQGRNANERTVDRLEDFNQIITRFDRLPTNYLTAVCLAATFSYRL